MVPEQADQGSKGASLHMQAPLAPVRVLHSAGKVFYLQYETAGMV